MALREMRIQGDPILEKPCKEVKELTDRLHVLIEDMKETMTAHDGVGLAAPQVGVLKRIVIIDVGDGPIVMVNPKILKTSGEQTGPEGCLSLPNMYGTVTRPNYVRAEYLDENMERCEIEGEGLFARAVCHELDHLEGHMYTELAEGPLYTAEELEKMQEEEGEDE